VTNSKINLSNRLLSLAKLVPQNAYLADIGSDHGFLPIYLVKSGKILKAFAIENKTGPFKRLQNNIKINDLTNSITSILSDGIKDIVNEVDTIVIAGMGAHTIIQILTSHKEKLLNIKNIIVDSHTDLALLRKSVSELGYKITSEVFLVENNIYYTLIKFTAGNETYNDQDYEFGPILRKVKPMLYKKYWNNRLENIDLILSNSLTAERKNELIEEKWRINENI
jgi:tRNA (adenine22-N1)-methyltransferase